jgi:hydroxymethylglutaryl-CoA lyase
MPDLPKKISIVEEGVREGCQIQDPPIPTAQKLELIAALSETGISKIQVASMVNAQRVPGWADADEVLERLPAAPPGVSYSAVWLNDKGFDRAWRHRDKLAFDGAISAPASEAFLLRNQNRTLAQNFAEQRERIAAYKARGLAVDRVGVMAAFGCNFEGEIPVPRVIEIIAQGMDLAAETDCDISSIVLADTMAWATPFSAKRMIDAVRSRWPEVEISLHLHDTRGMGIANAFAAMEMGVSRFDASLAGLGGCPFAGHKGAAGNVCTEDLVFLAHEAGIETGIDLDRLIETAQLAEQIFGRSLPGSVMKGGTLDRFRK